MSHERMVFRVAADKPGGGPTQPENAENGSKGIFFESVTDLKKNLIPWMRTAGLQKISVYAYEGNTNREVGHFIVSHEAGRTQLVDREGNSVALFMPPRTSGPLRQSRRPTGPRTVRIEEWLRQKGTHSAATFDIFPFEEGDEEQTEQEAAVEAGTEPVPAEAEQAAIPDVAEAQASVPPEESQSKKIKGPRQPRRKKPVKAERKARLAEIVREEFSSLVDEAGRSIQRISSFDGQASERANDAFSRLALFLEANPALKPAFLKLLRDPNHAELSVYVSMYRIDRAAMTRSTKLSSAYKYMRRVAGELYSETEHNDPDRSHRALHWSYESRREAPEYMARLFSDIGGPLNTLGYFHSRGQERWLDIGSGETYRVPLSLMNVMRHLNPKVKIVGLDPLYDETFAATTDKAQGRHKLDQEWAAVNELVAGTAQRMTFSDASFDQVLSVYAFDKFNEETGGTQQALRQMARILKPKGIARITGMDLTAFEAGSVLEKYFEIRSKEIVAKEDTDVGKSYANVILIRKDGSEEENAELREAIQSWLSKYPTPGLTGK